MPDPTMSPDDWAAVRRVLELLDPGASVMYSHRFTDVGGEVGVAFGQMPFTVRDVIALIRAQEPCAACGFSAATCAVPGAVCCGECSHGKGDSRSGAALIATERRRQIEIGYDAAHDASHSVDDLLFLAYGYLHTAMRSPDRAEVVTGRRVDPAGVAAVAVKAGALIAAAIDRLAAPNAGEPCRG